MIQMNRNQLMQLFPQFKAEQDFSFSGVAIDSRKIEKGNIFVAIKGDNFDGHDYLNDLSKKGVVAIVVDRIVNSNLPQIVVQDTREALALLANYWRKVINPIIIAITGSNGKTTVKEMLGQILSSQQKTLITQGNFNNDIGVPLTFFRLTEYDKYAVIEMGANHAMEIQYLMSIAQPDVVYVNNAHSAHVEGFGSLQGIVEAKGEMYQYAATKALAVINDDEAAAGYWKSICAPENQLSFSMQHESAISGDFQLTSSGMTLNVKYKKEVASCQLPLLGAHNAQNALAAVSLAVACKVSLQQACDDLQGFNGVAGRQQFLSGINDSRLIDDSYNANPDSLAAAVDVLCALDGEHWLALGDMAELGERSEELHIKAVKHAQQKGINQFFALGNMSCRSAEVFGAQGFCFSQHEEMAGFIAQRLKSGVNLLIKGSRSAGMDKLVKALSKETSPHQTVAENTAGECHAL